MDKRKLGNTGLEISPLIFGGNVFGWTVDEKTSFQLLDAFVDAGFNCIDTSDIYPTNNPGGSESVVGKWLQQSGKRDRIIIATKVGIDMAANGTTEKSNLDREHILQKIKVNLTKDYILQRIDASLKRLKTDYIDLYQAHRDDDSTPLEETLKAFDHLIKEGKVRAIGASNYSAERLSEALRISKSTDYPRYNTLQPCYNLYNRDGFEEELQDFCIREDIGVITYLSLGCGFLTGKYRSKADLKDKPRAYRVKDMINERGMRILKAQDTVANETGSTLAQVALAWLMAQPSVIAPIASATTLEQLKELICAPKLQLADEHLQMLNQASSLSD